MVDRIFSQMGDLKVGKYVISEEHPCRVVSMDKSKPGKHGHAKVRIEAVGIIDSKKREVVMPGHDNVETPIIEKRTAQVLSVSGNTANVMDSETYETFDLEIPEEIKGDVTDGAIIMYWDVLGTKVMKQLKSAGEEE